MAIVTVHSFRGGTGKSNATANLAALLARDGRRVGVIDGDIQSPGIHVLFGMAGDAVGPTLNDFLWHDADITAVAHDVTDSLPVELDGRIFLIPSSMEPGEIARVLREGYDAHRLATGLRQLVDELSLDVLLIDTHPGLNEETLLSLVLSEVLVLVLRPDRQDYEGTGVTVRVAQELQVPHILMVVNKTPAAWEGDAVARRVETAYGCEVAAVLPHSDDVMALASEGIFALTAPDHPVTKGYQRLAALLMDRAAGHAV